ncbi:MAG TPA: hypothetical protein VFX16_18280, partial [Pseudonocardiaceae bacterium]|nr:hypothetical protein [Pseudonocardiaceae bacterium]
MTSPHRTVTNTADRWSVVAIQAESLRDSQVFVLPPDASPQRKYEVGLRLLDIGVSELAHERITEAIAGGYDTAEVQFHWVLAMLSNRTYRELGPSDRFKLSLVPGMLLQYTDDEWKHGLQAICGLVRCMHDPDGNPGQVLKDVLDLHTIQRTRILRHLDMFLTGSIKDSLWANTRDEARDAQTNNDRMERAWAYFYSDPVGPRVRQPVPISTGTRERMLAVMSTVLSLTVVGYLGWLVLIHARTAPILAYLVAVPAGYVGARYGLEWRYRSDRLAAKEREHSGNQPIRHAPAGGFADRVDQLFNRYFIKYLPKGEDPHVWLVGTVGIRKTLRDEVVNLYREDSVDDMQISWLVRYMVSDVRKRWQNGTLHDYRERYRIRRSTKVLCCLGLSVLFSTGITVIEATIRTTPVTGSLTMVVVLIGGRSAVTRWLHIILERRRHAEEKQESEQCWLDRNVAFKRWRDKLNAKRPSEIEMENWLNCDRTMLLDSAMRHYKLPWRDIIGHAFLQTPAKHYKRARVHGGPWRYSRYEIRLFLITADGVREVNAKLNFEKATFQSRRRSNFRFNAVASVQVTKADQFRQTLELTLINGPSVTVRVTDPNPGKLRPGENAKQL